MADTVLLIGAEVFSRILDFTDRQTCILFGDGAGAAVVQAVRRARDRGHRPRRRRDRGRDPARCPAAASREPATAETRSPRAGTRVRMPNGREVFKRAVTEMAAACRELLEKNGHTTDDVDLLIPHQANARIMGAVAERSARSRRKAVVDVAEVGNTSAPPRSRSRSTAPGAPAGCTQGDLVAVHLVRRRPHVGRDGDALDAARAGRQ